MLIASATTILSSAISLTQFYYFDMEVRPVLKFWQKER